ncbi:MAG: long-chain fatty acid--CoA ligase [Alphaproteobacteria bacterium]
MAEKLDTKASRFETWPTLTAMFFDQAERLQEKPLLWAKRDGRYRSQTWREVRERVCALARGLRAAGLDPGDRVVLVSENRPEWLIADLAIMAAGCITVPAYVTNTPSDHRHVLANCGARAAIVSTRALTERVLAAAQSEGGCELVIAMDPPEPAPGIGVRAAGWEEILQEGAAGPGDVAAWASRVRRGDIACLIYTSGTGGAPKGVMLSHGAILSNCMGTYHLLAEMGLEDEVFLSFLPLSHSYEHTAGQFLPLSIGAQIYYAEGAEALVHNMAEARPTLMTAVPRLYETMHRRILRDLERRGGLTKRLFLKAVELGRRAYEAPESLSLRERLANKALDLLVRRKVRARFGGRLKAFISGGAPLSYEIGLFFTALGVRLLQGYGQTEAAPVVSCNLVSDNRLGTVGPPVKGAEVKIADDGEILVRGELVMQGYWGDAAATEAVIRDGWLHTGDIGELDGDGYITITDRKKDIIVCSGGDNVSPARIEGKLTLEPEVAQAMVYGDRRPYLVAVIVPDQDYMRHWAKDRGKRADPAALADDPDFKHAMAEAVDRVNRGLAQIEHVRRFVVAHTPFAIENGQLTPTLKVRRHKVEAAYAEALQALYAGARAGAGART